MFIRRSALYTNRLNNLAVTIDMPYMYWGSCRQALAFWNRGLKDCRFSNIRLGLGLGLRLRLGLWLGLGLGSGLLNCDFKNNIWRHLLNIFNDPTVKVHIAIFSYPDICDFPEYYIWTILHGTDEVKQTLMNLKIIENVPNDVTYDARLGQIHNFQRGKDR